MAGVGFTTAFLNPIVVSRASDLTDPQAEEYPLINPLLACGDIADQSLGEMVSLRKDLELLIASAKEDGVTGAAVYLRDLNNGPWLGINERQDFYPSALLKVPLMLAIYKEDEDKPGFLEKKVTYSKPIVYTQHLLPPAQPLELHHSYSVRELLARAIIYSDDEAAALLGNIVGFEKLAAVFTDFGLTPPRPDADYQMPVRTFASFFRVLYNASYIDRVHSISSSAVL
jgi:beta-lactamase class A